MEPDDLLCSRNARPQKDGKGSGQVPSLLAERARSECARPMRAVEGSLGHSLRGAVARIERPSPGLMVRLGVPVGGRVRKLGAVEVILTTRCYSGPLLSRGSKAEF